MSLKAGAILGERYRIGAVLGAGGMGTVYQATHLTLDQTVAVKVMTHAGAAGLHAARFIREAKLAARLRSEHVAHVLDFSTTPGGAPFIVLEYLEGASLADVLDRRGTIDVATAVDWVLQALVGVAEAHGFGIVHRDLKPGNLFLATLPDGEKIVKVMDFGLSKSLVPDDDASAITDTSAMMGTPAYCAPEVLRSARRANAVSDVFAMGVVLYQLLTGRTPFEGATIPDLVACVLRGQPVPPRSHVPSIPPLLEAAVLRCLAADPAARFGDVGELALAIAPFGARPELAKRVVRMLGGDAASERLAVSLGAHAVTIPASDDPRSVEPVGISTRLLESPPEPPGRSATIKAVALGALLAAVVTFAALVALPRLSGAPVAAAPVEPPPAAAAFEAPPPVATGDAPPPEPPPALDDTPPSKPRAPPVRRTSREIPPAPAASGTGGFGGRR